jgi:hypothetical protein
VRTTSTQNERKSRCVLLNRDFFLSSTDDVCVFCACDSRARDDEKNEVSSVSNNNERERKRDQKKSKALRDALVYVRVCVCIHT